ncbi:HNH endonuclease [Carnobacterium sp. FSL E2-0243]|uniref:HNH endonuclease n=1 Tax=Carnobacterium sp. FSL E2-0243 TaxID=2921365 RepID=UPI0030FA280B
MRALDPLDNKIEDFYEEIITKSRKKVDYLEISQYIIDNEAEYKNKGNTGSLYEFEANYAHPNSIIICQLSKKDVINIYTSYMVGPANDTLGRCIYNNIRSITQNSKCPYCGHRNVSTVDHYLPKSNYPFLCVVMENLVPSCKDCNTDKKDKNITSNGDLIIHPYFDREIDNYQWLFCKIDLIDWKEDNILLSFNVKSVDDFSQSLNERITNHFDVLNLDNLYSIEAKEEFQNQMESFKEAIEPMANDLERYEHFSVLENKYTRRYKNSWQRAFYQGLANYYLQV